MVVEISYCPRTTKLRNNRELDISVLSATSYLPAITDDADAEQLQNDPLSSVDSNSHEWSHPPF